ncbi:MAG: Gfo/Idh/MocA family oxidoreductase [bacterium]
MTVKVGIIGTGGRGIGFIRHINERKDALITALCDPNHVRMKKVAELKIEGVPLCIHKPQLYTTIGDMLSSEELDAVIITSPDYCHEANAIDALEKDIFVLIDKPLATTTEGCMNVLKAAKKSKATVMIGSNLRHDPTLMKVKEIVSKGDLGRIFMIENREFYDGGKTYLARWNGKQKYSGGLWVHKGTHDFDIFNWLNQGGKPLRVSAFAERSALRKEEIPFKIKPKKPVGLTCTECSYRDICPDFVARNTKLWGREAQAVDKYAKDLCIYTSDADVYDNGIAIVEYDNGVRASHLECFVTSLSDRLYTIVGTKGQLSASLHDRKIEIRPRWAKDVTATTIEIPKVRGGHGGADTGLTERFLEVVREKREPSSSLIDGTFSVAIGEAAEHSWREHRMVEISEVLDVNNNLLKKG